MHRRTATEELIREVLKESYLGLSIDRIELVEDLRSGEGRG